MNEPRRIVVTCRAAEGSGDLIVDLPVEVLRSMNVSDGASFGVEVVDGVIVLTPIRALEIPPPPYRYDPNNPIFLPLSTNVRVQCWSKAYLGFQLRSEGVLELAADVLGTKKRAYRWFIAPVRGLGGCEPCALVMCVSGYLQVWNFLTRLAHGIVA